MPLRNSHKRPQRPSTPQLILEHLPKEVVQKHVLWVKLLAQIQILPQRLLVARLRIPQDRRLNSLVDMRNSTVLNRQLAERPSEILPPDVLGIVVLRVDDNHVRVPAARQKRVCVLLDEVHDCRQGDQEVSLDAEAVEELSVGMHHSWPVGFREGPVVELEVRVVLAVEDAAVVRVDDEFASA